MPQTTGPIDISLNTPDGATDPMSDVDDEIQNLKGDLEQVVEVAHFSFRDTGNSDDGTRAGQIKPGWAPILVALETEIVDDRTASDYPEIFAYATDTDKWYLSWDDGGYAWVEVLDVSQIATNTTDIATNTAAIAAIAAAQMYTTLKTASASGQAVGNDKANPTLITGLQHTFTTPDDGLDYDLIVRATMSVYCPEDNGLGIYLRETSDHGGGGAATNDRDSKWFEPRGGAHWDGGISLMWATTLEPCAGEDYRYEMMGWAEHANCVFNPNKGVQHWSKMSVEIKPRTAP